MSEYYVAFHKMNTCATEMKQIRRDLSCVAGEIQDVANSSALSSMAYVTRPINTQLRKVQLAGTHADQLASAITRIGQMYRNCENEIAGKGSSGTDIKSITSAGLLFGNIQWTPGDLLHDDTFWKFAAEAGVLGSLTAMIGQFITGGTSAKNILKVVKYGAKSWEKISDLVDHSSGSFDWERLFGVQTADTKGISNFWDALKAEGDKYDLGNAKTVAGKSKVFAKWTGAALTVITKAYDNFHEENTLLRKIEETIGESIVSIGEGALISAGLTAAIAAAGVSVPAIAVGVASVGIVVGIDALCEQFWHKDFAELLSDTFLDQIVEPAQGKISGWWDRTTKNVSSFFRGWNTGRVSVAW